MAVKYSIKKMSSEYHPAILDIQELQYFFKTPTDRVSEPNPYLDGTMSFSETKILFDFLDYSQHDVAEVMEVDPSTLFRWKKEDKLLTRLLTKTIKDMDKVIAKGVRIFGTEALFSEWLYLPNHAMGNKKPADLMRDPNGLELVDQALEALSWGNFL
ncbi:antitoxin Xre/MbcA/ParS toxin-binding domain-containing protein [Aquiflexum sp.]|uniref:antitoxin Xre/MbcA/ParS toxin-binding domain-containing protein n=1 Tax=Aquiflexum sp. TaxID=1872584 RepID=UPI003593E13D